MYSLQVKDRQENKLNVDDTKQTNAKVWINYFPIRMNPIWLKNNNNLFHSSKQLVIIK